MSVSPLNYKPEAANVGLKNHGNQIVYASRVEFGNWNGSPAYIAHYPENISIVTHSDGKQCIWQNGAIMKSTNIWGVDNFGGNQFVRHIYFDGLNVYSNDFIQFCIYQ